MVFASLGSVVRRMQRLLAGTPRSIWVAILALFVFVPGLLFAQASDTPARMSKDDAARTALSVCQAIPETTPHYEVFRATIDCGCVAPKVAEAYSDGKLQRIDLSALDRFHTGCPQSRERLVAFYREHCFIQNEQAINGGANYRAWAFGGGCDCRANNSADRFLADAQLNNWRGAFSVYPECGERVGDRTPRKFSAAPDFGKPDVVDPKFTLTFEVPSGIRPFELWHLDGRPIQGFPQQSVMDRVMGPVAQRKELSRYVNLLLLMDEPGIIEKQWSASLALAFQNLPFEDFGRFLKGCRDIFSHQPGHCGWVDDAAKQTFVTQYVPRLMELAAKLPRELVFSESMQLGNYDTARQGFSISAVHSTQERYGFEVGGSSQGESLFDGDASLFAWRQEPLNLTFWPLAPDQAKTVVERLNARKVVPIRFTSSSAVLAWRYKIVGFRTPRGVGREMIVELIDRTPTLFADATLTIPLAAIPLDGVVAPR